MRARGRLRQARGYFLKGLRLLRLPYERREGELIVRRDEIRQSFEQWFRPALEQR